MLMAATTNKRRLLTSLMLGLLFSAAAAWLSSPDALAHAAYESSSPAFAEVLDESPDQISIRFTQELFRREGANAISVQHADSGEQVAVGSAKITNDDRRLMAVDVRAPLAPGRYLVSWTNLSAEDGDEDSGAYPFYVASHPTNSEQSDDRRIAADLLITYPGDEPQQQAADPTPTPSAPAVVRTDESPEPGLGVGPIVFLGVGIAAGLVLIGALGYHVGSRRRGA